MLTLPSRCFYQWPIDIVGARRRRKKKHASIYHETIMVPERMTIRMTLDTRVRTPARKSARFRRSAIAPGYLQRRARLSIRDIDLAFGRLSIVIVVDRPISTGQGKGAPQRTSIADSERDRKTSISPRELTIQYTTSGRVCRSRP